MLALNVITDVILYYLCKTAAYKVLDERCFFTHLKLVLEIENLLGNVRRPSLKSLCRHSSVGRAADL